MQSTLHGLLLPYRLGSALHRTCDTHRLFAPTFPIDTMSAQHLESAALSPWRFSVFMDSNPFCPTRTRMFDPYGGVLVDENEDGCWEIILFYGGRFLLTERCRCGIKSEHEGSSKDDDDDADCGSCF